MHAILKLILLGLFIIKFGLIGGMVLAEDAPTAPANEPPAIEAAAPVVQAATPVVEAVAPTAVHTYPHEIGRAHV